MYEFLVEDMKAYLRNMQVLSSRLFPKTQWLFAVGLATMISMSDQAAKAWIINTIKASGGRKTQKGLGAALGLSEPSVSRLLKGNGALGREQWRKSIAYLETSPPAELDLAPNKKEIKYVPVIGQLRAGSWRESLTMYLDFSQEIQSVDDDSYQSLEQYAYEVLDESASKINAGIGSFLICVNFEQASPKGPFNTAWVMVRHSLKSHGSKKARVLYRESPYIVEMLGKTITLKSAAKDATDRDDIHYRNADENIEIVSLIISVLTRAPRPSH